MSVSGIELLWDNEAQTIFRMDMGHGWTWEHFVIAVDDAHAQIAKKDYDVNLIMWYKARIPPGNAMDAFQHAGGSQPPNLRHTVFVNEATKFLDILVKNTDRKHGWTGPKIVPTLEEARTYLKTLD